MNQGAGVKQGGGGNEALGTAITALLGMPLQVATALAGAVRQQTQPGCEIPAPCWEPQIIGDCTLELAQGSTGSVRIDVANCGWQRSVVTTTAMGKLAGWLSVQPTTQAIDPQDRATFRVTVHVPKGLKPGQGVRGVILIRGCRMWAIRVHVIIKECSGNQCCNFAIEDCPDHVHHWYEHFYCPRPCLSHGREVPTTFGTTIG